MEEQKDSLPASVLLLKMYPGGLLFCFGRMVGHGFENISWRVCCLVLALWWVTENPCHSIAMSQRAHMWHLGAH